MRGVSLTIVAGCSLLVSGCIAKTAVDVVTLPVKAASKGVDMMTTSQSEADEKRGRALRKREAKLGKLERQYRKQSAKCDAGDRSACAEARNSYDEIQAILPTIPQEPER
ncbi:hypothetical protein GRI58_04145 [Porphyrobacter algicida]|uniref:Uncharacterized protein n=1 Tax=Qipengyuania algicida TaxID=1836209 RepID=A0A845AGC0_9SPHN|nr:hypothetical protein [Qipengyuania algicida]MXP28011.1 hypothetical protein [Qipengyuania algicida]